MAAYLGRRGQDGADAADREGRNREQDRSENIDRRGVRRIDQPTRGGTDNRRRLPRDAAHRDRARQHGGRHDIGRDRAHRRAGKDARNPVQRGKTEQQRQGQCVGPGEPAEQRGDDKIDQVGKDRHAPPLEPVGNPSRHRGQDRQRDKLDQAEQAELKRCLADRHAIVGACGVIELVPDDHDHRHRRHHRGETRQPIIAKIGKAERGGGFGRRPRHHRFVAICGRDRRHHPLP